MKGSEAEELGDEDRCCDSIKIFVLSEAGKSGNISTIDKLEKHIARKTVYIHNFCELAIVGLAFSEFGGDQTDV